MPGERTQLHMNRSHLFIAMVASNDGADDWGSEDMSSSLVSMSNYWTFNFNFG